MNWTPEQIEALEEMYREREEENRLTAEDIDRMDELDQESRSTGRIFRRNINPLTHE